MWGLLEKERKELGRGGESFRSSLAYRDPNQSRTPVSSPSSADSSLISTLPHPSPPPVLSSHRAFPV